MVGLLGMVHTWDHATALAQVIIFDWDDTLLCSSAINAQQWRQDQARLVTHNLGGDGMTPPYPTIHKG